jgi:hypothetical protein
MDACPLTSRIPPKLGRWAMHVHGSPSPAADEFPMNCDIVVTPRVGRTTGYVAATVIDDPRAGEECDQSKPGIVCGAGVEQWPDAAAAQ